VLAAHYGLGSTDYVYVGKVMVQAAIGFEQPNTSDLSALQGQVSGISAQLNQLSSESAKLDKPNTFVGVSESQLQIQNDQGDVLLNADTFHMTLTVKNLVVTGTLTVQGHIVTSGDAPQISIGSAACNNGNVSIEGNDDAGKITLTTGNNCTSGGDLLAVLFNKPYAAAPRVTMTPANANSAGLSTYVDSDTASTTSFALKSLPTAAPKESTTYVWYYQSGPIGVGECPYLCKTIIKERELHHTYL